MTFPNFASRKKSQDTLYGIEQKAYGWYLNDEISSKIDGHHFQSNRYVTSPYELASDLFAESANNSTEDDAAVVQQAITLLIPSILSDKELLLSFYNYADLKTWLTCLVLKSPQPKIREEGSKGITAFSTQVLKEEYVSDYHMDIDAN